ncbi:threonylcarbamoyl-AMP synthase-like [Babylonia areolata]|uniref:threonylcarbamoyl-AMP synthase-like n=1 Tax=Babylonia areolata TaxID=304850 RepID=UPI003FCF05C2
METSAKKTPTETPEKKDPPPCLVLDSHKSSSLQRAARLLRDEGCVVGVPTDTVYALAASCRSPASISRLYHVKGRPPEKPICLCLASLDQLRDAGPPFSALLWDFMARCYPGGISCVLPKGEWLQRLGVGESSSLLGTDDSICVRVPDCGPLAYVVSMAGPVAITSANISGAEDSVHHSMVLDSLGHKIDAMVCDGKSGELAPSTVVNCLKIDEGKISYFREGCTPIQHVDRLFREAKETTRPHGQPPHLNTPPQR